MEEDLKRILVDMEELATPNPEDGSPILEGSERSRVADGGLAVEQVILITRDLLRAASDKHTLRYPSLTPLL